MAASTPNVMDDILLVLQTIRLDVAGAVAQLQGSPPPSGGTPSPSPTPTAGANVPAAPAGIGIFAAGINRVVKTLQDILFNVVALRVRAATPPTPGAASPAATPTPNVPTSPTPISGTFTDGLSGGAARFLAVFTAVERGLESLGNQLSAFVAKANPAAVQRFTLAVSDLQAVIGRALTPILERVTVLIRKFGDAFASLSPVAQQLAGAVGVGSAIGTVIAGLIVGFKALKSTLGALPFVIGGIVGALSGILLRTSDGAALKKAFDAILTAMGNLAEALATALLPVIRSVLIPAFNGLASALEIVAKVTGPVIQAIGRVAGALGPGALLVVALRYFVRQTAAAAAGIAASAKLINSTLKLAGIGAAVMALDKINEKLGIFKYVEQAFDSFLDGLGELVSGIGTALQRMGGFFRDVFDELGVTERGKVYFGGGGSGFKVEDGKSTGAAVRQAQFSGLEEFARRQYVSAYQGTTEDIERESLNVLRMIERNTSRPAGGVPAPVADTGIGGRELAGSLIRGRLEGARVDGDATREAMRRMF